MTIEQLIYICLALILMAIIWRLIGAIINVFSVKKQGNVKITIKKKDGSIEIYTNGILTGYSKTININSNKKDDVK